MVASARVGFETTAKHAINVQGGGGGMEWDGATRNLRFLVCADGGVHMLWPTLFIYPHMALQFTRKNEK